MLPCRRQSAPSLRSPACSSARARLNDRMCRWQGLELLVTVLLARNRQPPPTVAAGVPHAEFAAELITLPSGLLAMVCEAIVKLTVRRGAACACVRLGCVGDERGPTRSRLMHGACQSIGGRARRWGCSDRMRRAGSTPSSTVLCRFPMWPAPAAIRIRALCVVVRD